MSPVHAPVLDTARLAALFAASSDLVVVTDAGGALRYSNAVAARTPDATTLFGALAQPCAELAATQRQVLADGQPRQLEVTGPHEAAWLHLAVSPVRHDGSVTGLLHTGRDVTARHLEEERLRRIEELMVDTQGIAHFGIWEWDITQPQATWTPGLYQIYGLTPGRYVPSYENYLQRVHPDDRQRVIDATSRVFHQLEPYSHDERIFHSDGSLRYLHTWAVPLLDAEGKLCRLMGVCLDITERKLAENAVAAQAAELAELNTELEARVEDRTRELYLAKTAAEVGNATKSLFLATMSHEVRTPMNGVLGMLELLMDGALSEEQRHMLATIRDSSEALLSILDDILDFSKIEAGRLEMETIPVNLRRIIEGVADTLSTNAQSRELRLDCFIDPALPEWLLGDQVRLRQILFNLGSNAIKFTHTTAAREGVVELRAERIDAGPERVGVRISVIDNGIGMDAATQAQLFRPFTQADASTTRRFGGTGLGLSICKRLVELMGGRIAVQSWPGTGSTFTVDLELPPAHGVSLLDRLPVRGLAVAALLPPGALRNEINSYLCAAGVQLSLHGCAADLEADLSGTAQAQVILAGPELAEADAAAWLGLLQQLTAQPELHLLRLTPRQREPQAPPPPGIVRVALHPLHYRELLTGLARASGHLPHAAAVQITALPADDGDESPLVLVAEDNPVNQEITCRQLERLGYRCLLAENGHIALEQWRLHPVALLLTDCQMPEMDGFELVQAIRHEERRTGRHLPVIALTANALRGEAERCQNAGMDDYLSKPLRLANLGRVLERWLGPSQAANGDVVLGRHDRY
jgi:PAS domain S-box-containing protein